MALGGPNFQIRGEGRETTTVGKRQRAGNDGEKLPIHNGNRRIIMGYSPVDSAPTMYNAIAKRRATDSAVGVSDETR